MAAGIEINMSNATEVRAAFREYVQFRRGDVDSLWKDQSRKYANDLYNETAAITPTRSDIAAEVKQLGWRIPTRFADGRLGRGVPKNWLGYAYTKMRRRVRRRGRKSKADHLEEADFMAQKPTLQQMQQFVIDLRTKARLYLASGWLGAIIDLGGTVKARGGGDPGSGRVDRERGGATITRSTGFIAIMFWNRTPGIETMQDKKDFVGKARVVRIADMWVYIKDREAKGRQRLNR